MIGSVSCTLAGVPAVFTLTAAGVWEVEHRGVPDALLDAAVRRLIEIAEDDRGPAFGPYGPDQINRAAELLGGVPYVAPRPSGSAAGQATVSD